MNRLFRWLLFCVCCSALCVQAKSSDQHAVDAPTIQALFSPQDNIQAVIVRSINSAKKQVLVQAYLLTDNKIADALVAAHRRGLDVKVLLDAERDKINSSDGRRLADAGVKVRLETAYDNAHNKIIIIDGKTLLTGSYNFTHAAQYKNAENVLLIQNAPKLLIQYITNWQKHFAAASSYK